MHQYKIKSPSKKFKGWMILTYQDGHLTGWERSKLCQLTEPQKAALLTCWPWLETNLEALAAKGLSVEKIEKTAVQKVGDKVALFCSVYNKFNEGNYKVLKSEGLLMAQIEVTADLVKAYMLCNEWWANPKSIGGFVKNINAIRSLLQNQGKPKSSFPNEWSLEAERNCKTGPELMAFRTHLHSLGLRPVKHEVTKQVIKWE